MNLLLLEDDLDLGQAVTDHLRAHGHTVHWAQRCQAAGQAFADPALDMALLDLRLPDGSGLDLVRHWRQGGDRRPVLALTARDQISDRIEGLQAGADDYLVKPFDLNELLARIDAVWRRCQPAETVSAATPVPGATTPSALSLDFDRQIARRQGELINLTAMEWSLLAVLSRQPGSTVSKEAIRQAFTQIGRFDSDSNSLEVIVSRLRRKLGADLISTHRGLGYRLEIGA
jgi:two-component system OmpR family response regulator